MSNIKLEAMKDEILKILTKNFKANHMEYQNALNKLLDLYNVSNSFHCQRQEEMESKCDTQCDHCKEYYKGTDNGC